MNYSDYLRLRTAYRIRIKMAEDARLKLPAAVYQKQVRSLEKKIRRGEKAKYFMENIPRP